MIPFPWLILFSCFSFSYGIITSALGVECDPSVVSPNSGASCLPVQGPEASCNGETPFLFQQQLTECFGEDVNVFLDIGAQICRPCPNINTQPENSNLYVTYSFNFRYYILSITHSDVDMDNYVLLLEYDNYEYCLCINANETELNLTLQYPRFENQDIVISYPPFQDTFQSPRHCADYRHIHYDASTCGLPQLEKPRNVVLQCNETHTRISWEPACYMKPGTTEYIVPDQDTYYLTLITCDERETHYFTIHHTTAVTVNISTIVDFELYAYSSCSGLYQTQLNELRGVVGCSKPANSHDSSDSSSCVVPPLTGCSTPTPTPSPDMGTDPTSPSSDDDYLPVYIAAGVGGLVILITVLVIAVMRLMLCKHTTRPMYSIVQQEFTKL